MPWSSVQKSLKSSSAFAATVAYPKLQENGPKRRLGGQFISPFNLETHKEQSNAEHQPTRKPSSQFISPFNLETLKEAPNGYLNTSDFYFDKKNEKPRAAFEEEKSPQPTDSGGQNEEGIKEIMKTFCLETSAHGLPHLVKGSGWSILRGVWLVIFTCAMVGECVHLSLLIDQYLQYPSMDSFRLSETEPTFPSITICNSDPFSDVGYWYSGATPSFDHYYYWAENVPFDNGWTFYNRANSAKGMFENVNRTELMLLGHQLTDLVMNCTYRGIPCDYENDFVQFETPTFFNCFTYNVPDTPVDTGPDKGLTMVLFLEGNPDSATGEKLFTRDSQVEQSFGGRIQIHEKGTLPNPGLSGINILPGHSTAISLKQSTRKKLGSPFSSCEPRKTLADLKEYKYSTEGCYDVCKLHYVYNRCGCINPDTPIPDSLRDRDVYFCGTYNESYFNTTDGFDEWKTSIYCEKEALLDFTTEICDNAGYHACQEGCTYSTYEVSVSQSVWPSVVALRDVYFDFVQGWKAYEVLYDAYTTGTREELRDLMWYNLARVNIYFNEARVVEIREMQSMTIYDLFANVGGTIGLWAGLSVITVLEFLSLPIQLLTLYFQRDKRIGANTTQISPLR